MPALLKININAEPCLSGMMHRIRSRAAYRSSEGERTGQQDQGALDLQEAGQWDLALNLQTDFQRLQPQMTDGIDEQGRELSGKAGEYPQKK